MILPVSILFILFSFLSIEGGKNKHIQFKLSVLCIILALIAAFRPDMADKGNYLSFWYGYGEERFEKGFVILSDIFHLVSNNEYWFLFAFAFLSIGLKLWAIKRMTNLFYLSLLIYISNIFILHDMIQMRCAIASGFLLHAVYYIVNKDFKRFVFTFILAFSFHYSSLIILPMWFLNNERINKYLYIGLIISSYIIGGALPLYLLIQYIPIEGIQNLWNMYKNTIGDEVNIFNATQLGRVAICSFIIFTIDRIRFYNKYAIILTKIYAISLFIFVTFSSVPVLSVRLSELYQVVEILLIPLIVYSFRNMIYIKKIAVIGIGLCFLLMNIFYNNRL